MKLLKKLKSNSVQLVITSHLIILENLTKKKKPLNYYLQEQEKTLKECFRVLNKKGSLCWQIGSYFKV